MCCCSARSYTSRAIYQTAHPRSPSQQFIDAALEHERTPGTFRNACRQAAQGQPLSLGLSSPVLSRELTNGARRWAEPKDAAAPKASAPGKGGRPNLEVKVPRDSSRTCVVS